jgi:hypothetical protein
MQPNMINAELMPSRGDGLACTICGVNYLRDPFAHVLVDISGPEGAPLYMQEKSLRPLHF